MFCLPPKCVSCLFLNLKLVVLIIKETSYFFQIVPFEVQNMLNTVQDTLTDQATTNSKRLRVQAPKRSVAGCTQAHEVSDLGACWIAGYSDRREDDLYGTHAVAETAEV